MPSSYAIGKHFEEFIRDQIRAGRYMSASKVVRDALRLLEEEEDRRKASLEALRAEVTEGLESGKGRPAAAVLDRLERKYAKVTSARRCK